MDRVCDHCGHALAYLEGVVALPPPGQTRWYWPAYHQRCSAILRAAGLDPDPRDYLDHPEHPDQWGAEDPYEDSLLRDLLGYDD